MNPRFALTLAAVWTGCVAPPEDGQRSEALVAGIESGSIAVAACPCSDITAVSAADGHIEVFARSSSDGGLWRIWEAGGTYAAVNAQRLTLPALAIHVLGRTFWLPAESIERAPTAVLSHADNLVHVFYTRASDNALVEQRGGGGTTAWSGTEISRGTGLHDPAALELDDESLVLVASGDDGQPRVSYLPSGSSAWTAFSLAGALPAGNAVSGKISPVQDRNSTLWLFARLGDGSTWSTLVPPRSTSFPPWTSLGGYMQFPAVAAADVNGYLNVVGVGGDGQIWLDLETEAQDGFGGWVPLVPGAVSGVASAANSAPVVGKYADPGAADDGRLEIFFTNNSGDTSGSFWSVAQIAPGTWNHMQTGIAQPGGYGWAANSAAVATEADGRLTGFSLDAGGSLRFARAAKPVASLALGDLVGRYQGLTAVFKGVPFAQPPIGALRWQPPQDITAPWGSRDAGTFASKCPQHNDPLVGNEDCLYLNVFAPTSARRVKVPVMVFVHGGGNYNGSALDFDAASLVNRAAERGTPVLVVTIQYRLGVFGWLAYPGHATGNFALLDQIKALEWVHQNIARFGGDPQRVLIFGQSAGARDVELIAASPLVKGRHLFSAAVMQSGAGVLWTPPVAQVQHGGELMAQSLGCASDWNCLLSQGTAALVTAAGALRNTPNVLRSSIDGAVLTENIRASLAHNLEVPIIVGSNRDEAATSVDPDGLVTADDYAKWVNETYAPGESYDPTKPFDATVAPRILALYPPIAPNSVRQLIALDTDGAVVCLEREAARVAAGAGLPVYRYLFTHALEDPNHVPNQPVPSHLGAFHGAELAFVFGSLGSTFGGPYRPTLAEQALSDTMIGYWTRFAATGDPNGGGAPVWPRYTTWSAASDPIFLLDDTVQLSSGYHIAQCDFFAQWQ